MDTRTTQQWNSGSMTKDDEATRIGKEAKLQLLDELRSMAESRGDACVELAMLDFFEWVVKGYCTYCGSPKHDNSNCEIHISYMREVEREGSH